MPRPAPRGGSAELLAALKHFDRAGPEPDPVTRHLQTTFDRIDACPELRNASRLLAEALKASGDGAPLLAPPGWLPPLL
jgi:hypothetical protein